MLDGLEWLGKAGANEAEIDSLKSAMPVALPERFYNLLRESNGGEGPLFDDPFNLCLFSVAEMLNFCERFGTTYPGFIFFGCTGGGDYIAFDTNQGPPFRIVDMELLELIYEPHECAADFDAFLEMLGRRDPARDLPYFGELE